MNEKSINVKWNIAASLLIKGAAILVSLLTIPEYMNYFETEIMLGAWYIILNILTWVTMFDLGIGNGLRNKLTEALIKGDTKEQREYISSAYVASFIMAVLISLICMVTALLVNWNLVFNVPVSSIDKNVFRESMIIVFAGLGIQLVLKLINSIMYAVQKSSVVSLLTLSSNMILLVYMKLANGNVSSSLIAISIVHAIANSLPLLTASILVFKTQLREVKPNLKYFRFDYAKNVLSIGVIILWLQIAMMFVGCSHSIVISHLISPGEVTEFNIYFKLFNGLASVLTLILVPIWSNVTKAQAENDYQWILIMINKLWLLLVLGVIIFVGLSLTLPIVFDIWLGDNTIEISNRKIISSTMYSLIFILHNMNTSISNGLSRFKVQNICMLFAVILFIPISSLLVKGINDWSAVVFASSICLVPYEIIQPVSTIGYVKRQLKHNY